MSRVRFIYPEVLNSMPLVNQINEKLHSNLNLTQDKVVNLTLSDCTQDEIFSDNNNMLSEMNVQQEDWLKQKTLYTSMDFINNGYLHDINFLSTEYPDICSSTDANVELVLVDEKNDSNNLSNPVVNEKSSNLNSTDPLLNILPINEVLLRKHYTKTDNLLNEKDYISDSEIILNKTRRIDTDVECNTEFSDLNWLSFSLDTNEGISESINESLIHTDILSMKSLNLGKLEDQQSITNLDKTSNNNNNNKSTDSKTSISDDTSLNVIDKQIMAENSGKNLFYVPTEELECTVSILNDISVSYENNDDNEIQDLSHINNMVGLPAIVSNSVENSKPKTEVTIKTNKGDEKYEGNTSEFMDSNSISRKTRKKSAIPNEGEHIVVSVKTAATIKDESKQKQHEPDDNLISEMLNVLGITDNKLYTLFTNHGLRIWICPERECRRIFNRLNLLKLHILNHYGLKPFKCNYPGCRWSFYTSFKLKRHQETHLKRKNFVCTVTDCNRSFTTIYNLNTHLKLHERPARLKCLVRSCNYKFQTRRAMEMHLKTHEMSLAPYKCMYPGCSKLYYSCSALTAHSRCHSHKEEELRCQWENCGRLFDKPCRLKAHMRQHTGDKPYVCKFQDCKWAFTSSSKLRRHQYKHNNERKFRCTIGDCTKAFMRSEHLREHTFTHIAQRTFHCSICGEKCSAKATLYVHKKKFHPNVKSIANNSKILSMENNIEKKTSPIKTVRKTNENEGNMLPVPISESSEKTAFFITLVASNKNNRLNPISLDTGPVSLHEDYTPLKLNNNVNEHIPKLVKSNISKKVNNASKSCARTYLSYCDILKKSDKISTSPSICTTRNTISAPTISITDKTSEKIVTSISLPSNITLESDVLISNRKTMDNNTTKFQEKNQYILLFNISNNNSESTINLKDLEN